MNYDRKHHITTDHLADLLGIDTSRLGSCLSAAGAPRALFRATVGGRQQSIYDRFEAVAWVDDRRAMQRQERRGEVVPPRQPRPISEQGQYRPSPGLQMAFDRAAELYPHRIITPDAVGNHRGHVFHDRVRLTQ